MYTSAFRTFTLNSSCNVMEKKTLSRSQVLPCMALTVYSGNTTTTTTQLPWLQTVTGIPDEILSLSLVRNPLQVK